MFLIAVAAATMAASPVPGIRVEFADHQRKDGNAQSWYRYDMRLRNDASESRTLSLCPNDALMFATERGMRNESPNRLKGFALAVDGDSWRFSCIERTLAQGESLMVSMYFRHWDKRRLKPMRFATSLGTYEVIDGKVIPVGNSESSET